MAHDVALTGKEDAVVGQEPDLHAHAHVFHSERDVAQRMVLPFARSADDSHPTYSLRPTVADSFGQVVAILLCFMDNEGADSLQNGAFLFVARSKYRVAIAHYAPRLTAPSDKPEGGTVATHHALAVLQQRQWHGVRRIVSAAQDNCLWLIVVDEDGTHVFMFR